MLLEPLSISLFLLLLISVHLGALQPPLHPRCVAPPAFPARRAREEPYAQNVVNHIPAPLGGVHSLIMLSGNVFLARFQQLTKKFISKPSMQPHLHQNKIEKVRIGDKTACNERKRLHLLDSGLTS